MIFYRFFFPGFYWLVFKLTCEPCLFKVREALEQCQNENWVGLLHLMESLEVSLPNLNLQWICYVECKCCSFLSHKQSAERCVSTLLDLIQTKVNYVVQEAIIVIKVKFRTYFLIFCLLFESLCSIKFV